MALPASVFHGSPRVVLLPEHDCLHLCSAVLCCVVRLTAAAVLCYVAVLCFMVAAVLCCVWRWPMTEACSVVLCMVMAARSVILYFFGRARAPQCWTETPNVGLSPPSDGKKRVCLKRNPISSGF